MRTARPQLIQLSVSGAHKDSRMKSALKQRRVFSAEEHLKSRLAAGGVTNQDSEAESLNLGIKIARAELVNRIALHISQFLMLAINSLLAGHMVYATHVSAGRPCRACSYGTISSNARSSTLEIRHRYVLALV